MRARRDIAVVGAALAAFAGANASATAALPAKPVNGVTGKVVRQNAAAVREYWTLERMRAAVPMTLGPRANLGPPAAGRASSTAAAPGRRAPARKGASAPRAEDVSSTSAGFPERVHGKVFLTLDRDYECSATVVASPAHTLVWTAGHCVNGADIGLGFARNWIFVPGYDDSQRPYGSWTAKALYAADGWANEANARFDLGAAELARDAEGRGIEDVVGARGIAFNQPRAQTFDAYGYPAADPNSFLFPPNFDGDRLWLCRSPRTADDNPPASAGPATIEINCDMTAGSSGGGWVIGSEFVNSVTSYGYQLDTGHLYGPYMGTAAEHLYRQARGSATLCAGRPATNVGGPGDDDFSGSAGADSFVLHPGDDRADAAGGSDRVCGSGGSDRLVGGPQADILRGAGGADVLVGGPGRDVCIGGAGRDRARGCERRRAIP